MTNKNTHNSSTETSEVDQEIVEAIARFYQSFEAPITLSFPPALQNLIAKCIQSLLGLLSGQPR